VYNEYAGRKDDMHDRRGTQLARRHCPGNGTEGCGKVIPDFRYSGYCTEHYKDHQRELARLRQIRYRDRLRRAAGKPDRKWSRERRKPAVLR
jgi:hypothetical protein